jgi:hypothetical protein
MGKNGASDLVRCTVAARTPRHNKPNKRPRQYPKELSR